MTVLIRRNTGRFGRLKYYQSTIKLLVNNLIERGYESIQIPKRKRVTFPRFKGSIQKLLESGTWIKYEDWNKEEKQMYSKPNLLWYIGSPSCVSLWHDITSSLCTILITQLYLLFSHLNPLSFLHLFLNSYLPWIFFIDDYIIKELLCFNSNWFCFDLKLAYSVSQIDS